MQLISLALLRGWTSPSMKQTTSWVESEPAPCGSDSMSIIVLHSCDNIALDSCTLQNAGVMGHACNGSRGRTSPVWDCNIVLWSSVHHACAWKCMMVISSAGVVASHSHLATYGRLTSLGIQSGSHPGILQLSLIRGSTCRYCPPTAPTQEDHLRHAHGASDVPRSRTERPLRRSPRQPG